MPDKIDLKQTRPIAEMTAIHQSAFPDFFLTFLGENFIKTLYQYLLEDSSGFGYGINEDDHLVGFVIGSSQPGGLYKRLLKKHVFAFGWAALPAFIKNPAILPRLIRAFSKPSEPMPEENCGTLMSIAVLPSTQGKGYGGVLVKTFLAQAQQFGLDYINLTTDARDNEYANHFYQAQGFSLVRAFSTPEDREMNEYLIAVNPNQKAAEERHL